MWVVLLKRKDQALQAFRIMKMAAEVEAEAKLKALCTDRGGEFKSNEFNVFCEAHGIQQYLTAPYSPQQNSIVERRNQTVVAMARSMMKSKGMPGRFWGDAVSTAIYLLNRAPTKSVVGMMPYEAWYGRKPSVDHLRTFGCMAHVKTVTVHTSKLADRSTPMVMIGYEAGTKAYRAYNPVNKKLVVIRDGIFDEKKSWNWSSAEPVELILDEIFTIVYADDQGVGTHVGANVEDMISGPEATSSGGGDLSPHTKAGGLGCSASP
jgi:transposase InsO family protein